MILIELVRFVGLTKYSAIKFISKKRNLAPSSLKYILKNLKEKKLIDYNGKIEISEKGFLLIKKLRVHSSVAELTAPGLIK